MYPCGPPLLCPCYLSWALGQAGRQAGRHYSSTNIFYQCTHIRYVLEDDDRDTPISVPCFISSLNWLLYSLPAAKYVFPRLVVVPLYTLVKDQLVATPLLLLLLLHTDRENSII